MHLKRLQLHGFKTFAEKTEIEFAPGVTAIVGPNGSGKSNLSDALLWVLGEQKASALRGSKSSDVIFSGSDTRRPMGMAEVSLTVDNSDGTLPVDFGEVTITRRAYRTGDGEFFLNKVPCRLKDLYELFLDTGVGREAYSIVNQSEIDKVLSVNPEDRRGLFEEAAGIRKYRVKKREALRKLEATEGNLTRVRDILGELTARLEPLRTQAERAEKFQNLRERLRAIETNLLIVDLRFVDYEMTATRSARLEDETAAARRGVQIADAEARASELAAALADAEIVLDTSRQNAQAALTHAERLENQRALAAQRAESLAHSARQAAAELDELAERRTRLVSQLSELDAELQNALADEARLRQEVADRQASAQTMGDDISRLTRLGERRRQETLALARRQAGQQADFARAEARVAELSANLPALEDEATRLTASVGEFSEASRLAQNSVETSRLARDLAEKAVGDALVSRDSARAELAAARAVLSSAESQIIAVQTRLRTLQDLEWAQEGYFAGVRAVFEAGRHGALSGSFLTVADAFVTPPGFEIAFETALAASLQDIITDTEDDAKAAIAYLHEHRAGRATFLPLNRMRPPRDILDLGGLEPLPPTPSPERRGGAREETLSPPPLRSGEGVGGRGSSALSLITFEPRVLPALDVLLGRVIVCETLDAALQTSKSARGWNRIVTQSGELILPTGALTGGRQSGRGQGNLLGRKTEITELQAKLTAGEQNVKAAQKTVESASNTLENAEKNLTAAQAQRQNAQAEWTESGRRAEYADREARRVREASGGLAQRIASAKSSLETARETAKTAEGALQTSGAQTADADDAQAAETDEIRRLTDARDMVQAELTSARIALATTTEKAVSLNRSRREASNEADALAHQAERRTRQSADAQAEGETLTAQARDFDAQSTQAAERRRDANAALETAQAARQTFVKASQEAAADLRTLHDSRTAALEETHKNALRETRLQVQRDQLAGRLWDEYEMTADDALALPEDPEITDGTPTEVARLRRELRAMGDVNTGAVAEWEETRARHEFLTTQAADLSESRAKLLTAIGEIDASTRGVFMETFQAVGAAFDAIFTRLFGGGKTELSLTTPDDLLETGIDIHVQPPGKKRQNLALLSGGERALTAAALLFAFLQVKPSPFCVLDEVDAPLDGANVERFADLLREFGQKSQFIIITHNPSTMEAAPVWYGVTMPQPGISRILGLSVPEVQTVSDSPILLQTS